MMSEADSAKPLGRAISESKTRVNALLRALLIAADQRCPAIIGQAHLLCHGDLAAPAVARKLRELRREAADLLAAIAAAEAALQDSEPSGGGCRHETDVMR
jgi:hypothetical protein